MCYSRTHRNFALRMKIVRTKNPELYIEIHNIRYKIVRVVNYSEKFLYVNQPLEDNYLGPTDQREGIQKDLQELFSYFKNQWVNSPVSKWYEAAYLCGISNNQGIEGTNEAIETDHTFQSRCPWIFFTL